MATVHVFVGQCGNQLGCAFLDALASAAEASRDEEYQMRVSAQHFRPPLRAEAGRGTGVPSAAPFQRQSMQSQLPQPRCVMVDMEPKVIEEAIQRVNGRSGGRSAAGDEAAGSGAAAEDDGVPFYRLAPQQCVTRGEGSANNWAYGYYEQGESRRANIEECLRRECESSSSAASVSTFHVVHSVAGGTGSGVGCLVADVVRDAYPRAALLHSIVWPFSGGEVITQWYNAVLAMSNLRDTADGVCIAYNDEVASALQSVARHAAQGGATRGPERSVSFDDINRFIAHQWSALHLPQLLYAVPPPLKDLTKNRIQQESVLKNLLPPASLPGAQRYACTEDVIESLALDPAKKFFTSTYVPAPFTAPRGTVDGVPDSNASNWTSVLGDAARTSRQRFPRVDDGSYGISGCGALWLMRGRDARTEGLRALQDVLASYSTGDDEPPLIGRLFVSPDVEGHKKRRYTPQGVLAGSGSADTAALREVAMFGHSPSIPTGLTLALQHVEKQLAAGAFTYQFARYGVDRDTLRDAAMRLWDTVHAYSFA